MSDLTVPCTFEEFLALSNSKKIGLMSRHGDEIPISWEPRLALAYDYDIYRHYMRHARNDKVLDYYVSYFRKRVNRGERISQISLLLENSNLSPCQQSRLLDVVIEAEEWVVLQYLARNPNLSPLVAHAIIDILPKTGDYFEDIGRALANQPMITKSMAERLFLFDKPEITSVLAKNPAVPNKLVKKMISVLI